MNRGATHTPIHVVTDDAVVGRPDFLATARAILALPGIRLHLRAHTLSGATFFELAAALKAPNLIINDRVDSALAAGAAAVQLGARSLPVAEVRRIAPALAIGYSAHAAGEARAAEAAGAEFVVIGTIYPSASHPGQAAAGLRLIEECRQQCAGPLIAIGGVTRERVSEVRAAGADGVAIIRAVWDAPDPVQAAAEFVNMLR